jgi:hypothetical protein
LEDGRRIKKQGKVFPPSLSLSLSLAPPRDLGLIFFKANLYDREIDRMRERERERERERNAVKRVSTRKIEWVKEKRIGCCS